MTPPKHPYASHRITSAPALRAPSAADKPAGPPPTTKTSHLARTGTLFGFSTAKLIQVKKRNLVILQNVFYDF